MRRQAHEGAQAGGRDLPLGGCFAMSAIISASSSELAGVARAAAQEIERRVVCDAEQPAFRLTTVLPADASTALASASCTTSSPSITEPVMRAQ